MSLYSDNEIMKYRGDLLREILNEFDKNIYERAIKCNSDIVKGSTSYNDFCDYQSTKIYSLPNGDIIFALHFFVALGSLEMSSNDMRVRPFGGIVYSMRSGKLVLLPE